MFQIATHPTSFNRHPYHHHQIPISLPSPSVQLPRTLARPPFAEVNPDAIAAAAPELAGIPAEYIRCNLIPRANEMLAGNASLSRSHLPHSISRPRLPSALSVPLQPVSSTRPSYPTHILAVSSSKSSSEQATIYPVHALVLAAHCSNVPRLPAAIHQPNSTTLTLPVLPLSVPSPAAFSILHTYMYHRRPEKVLKALFPIPASFLQPLAGEAVRSTLASRDRLHQLSSYLCGSASSNLQTLTTHAVHVKDLWQDMVALGIQDPVLWDTLDLAWEVVLGALNLAAMGK